ncbi:MAG: hypothetical protein ACLPVF_01870, partial [Acidimicrobiales bacterium]
MSDDTDVPVEPAEAEEAEQPEEAGPERSPLDVFVFAPVGLALTVVEDLPGLIDKGRRRVEIEIGNARVMGQWVVTKGHRQVTRRLTELMHSPGAPGTEPPTEEPGEASRPPATVSTPAPDPADRAMVERTFAGYDTLSASQVVRRLDSLDADLLRAVQRYEASHRNRRTILSRAQQLLDADHPATAPPPDSAPTPDIAPPPDSAPPPASAPPADSGPPPARGP